MGSGAAGRTAAGRAAEQDALEALRHHWGEAYEIEHSGEHRWRAKRRDGLGGWLTAGNPDELLRMIAADYALKPVQRGAPPADRS